MKSILFIIGTRPNIIKTKPVYDTLKNYFNIDILYTGQHYNTKLSNTLFKEFNLENDIHCVFNNINTSSINTIINKNTDWDFYYSKLLYLYNIIDNKSSPTIYFLFFADTGNIWSDFNNVDIFDLKRSAGIGIRINMPMLGIIGYDIGYGFDHYDDSINKPIRWEQHLIFGVPLN